MHPPHRPRYPLGCLGLFFLCFLQVAGFDTFHESVSDLCTAVVGAELHDSVHIFPNPHSLSSVSLRCVWGIKEGARAQHNPIVIPVGAT